MINLSIIIPVYNEINYLEIFTQRLLNSFKDYKVEYIFINDGSSDGSDLWLINYVNINTNNNFKLINLKKNYGKGNALHEGIKLAKGKLVLFQDADLELDTNDSLEMLKIINNNPSIDCLFGSRYLTGKLKKNNNYLNEFVGKLNSLIFNILFNQSLSDIHCGTKIISKNVLDKLNLTIKDFGFEIDIAAQISKNNFDIYEYGVSYFSRTKKEGKKINWIDGLKSYFYLFKTRFLQSNFSTTISIFYSVGYMSYIGSHFGSNFEKNIIIIFFSFIGLFIGLRRKLLTSSIVFLFLYLGILLDYSNIKFFIIILFFIMGLYLSKK